MRWITHPVVTALSLTNLFLLFLTAPLTSVSHTLVFNWSGSISMLLVPVLVVFGLMWVVLTMLLWASERSKRMRIVVWTGVALALPLALARARGLETGGNLVLWPEAISLGVVLASFAAAVSPWGSTVDLLFERVRQVLTVVLGFGVIGALVTIGQMLLAGWDARNLNGTPVLHHVVDQAVRRSGGPRIVWIVLDELSYQQVFEARFPGLQLPTFDRLASRATVFTHVVPAGIVTENVMPSLVTGRRVEFKGATGDGRRPDLLDSASAAPVVFDPHVSVFQDALDAGYVTGASGWYIPYCRVWPSVLDRCFWIFDSAMINRMAPNGSIWSNLWDFLARAGDPGERLWRKLRLGGVPSDPFTHVHQEDYDSIMKAVADLLTDRRVNFALLHLPVPHPQGIYDRATGRFSSTPTSYIDNLALADHALAQILAQLEQQGELDSATVLVMGDHSWRTFMWQKEANWTREDQAASHGQFDDRPAYIVKLPGQQTGTRIETR